MASFCTAASGAVPRVAGKKGVPIARARHGSGGAARAADHMGADGDVTEAGRPVPRPLVAGPGLGPKASVVAGAARTTRVGGLGSLPHRTRTSFRTTGRKRLDWPP